MTIRPYYTVEDLDMVYWIAEGILKLEEMLAKHAAFDLYLKEHSQ